MLTDKGFKMRFKSLYKAPGFSLIQAGKNGEKVIPVFNGRYNQLFSGLVFHFNQPHWSDLEMIAQDCRMLIAGQVRKLMRSESIAYVQHVPSSTHRF